MNLFGTDGIRGHVGEFPMTPDTVLKFGWAFGKSLGDEVSDKLVLIGKDTRASGYIFESVLEAGLVSAGVNVGLLGPLPTPTIASLVRKDDSVGGGLAISASHNPHHDNGIKFFSSSGEKLSSLKEKEIEEWFEKPLEMVEAADCGKAIRIDDAPDQYIDFCVKSLSQSAGKLLQGMRLAVDCANGAAYFVAPQIYRELGAEVSEVGVSPDGFNINYEVGVMAPEQLRQKVISGGFDCGIALDGDGDRLLMVDSQGRLMDGDDLLFLIADYRHRNGLLDGGVVGTLMTNIGLEEAFRARDIPFERSDVGDYHVLKRIKEKGWQLGGEPSGHLMCMDKSNSCDAIINSLVVLELFCKSKKTFSELLEPLNKHYQTLINVPVGQNANGVLLEDEQLRKAISAAELELGENGRVLVRASGTEPLLRVMVESASEDTSLALANRIADCARESFHA